MNNPMVRWERYAPIGIGLEDMFKRLDTFADSSASTNYPPYNIVKLDDERQQLQVALAGFIKDDIEVAVEKGVLNISVSKDYQLAEGEYVHRGIALRSFSRNWKLSDDTVVDSVSYNDGMLRVTLVRHIPEEHKRKLFPIS